MFIDQRSNNDLVMLTDFRHKIDAEMGGVLNVPPLKAYEDCTRIALFDYKQVPSGSERADAKAEVRDWLLHNSARVTCVIPTVAFDPEDRAETICWSLFKAPSHVGEMRSTFYDWAVNGSGNPMYVTPLFGFSPFLKVMQHWQNAQTLERARRVSQDTGEVVTCHCKMINPDAYHIRSTRDAQFLSVDIESIEGSDLIMAVGISDGLRAMSVPVDAYLPYGHEKMEAAGTPEVIEALKEVLANDVPKVFHNYTFDVPRLERRGFKVNGLVHDTFCAMAIAYPELGHGLQVSCAALMAIPPWKSCWKPKLPGFTRDDVEFWTCDPIGLRDYNADDAFYTWHLADKVLPDVGIKL